jgi:small subunit ribosomal protein S1
MNSSIINNNQHRDADDYRSFKKIDQTKARTLYSVGDDGLVPFCEDLISFFNKKLDVVTTTIKNLILDARVCRIDAGNLIVDMNLKNYGRLPKEELRIGSRPLNVGVGDVIQVVAESIDAKDGHYINVSWEKAKRVNLWDEFAENMKNKTILRGSIVSDTRGGYVANIQGVKVFVPGSHLDFKPMSKEELEDLKSNEQPFIILSMEKDEKNKKDNIVVSRREVLNQERMRVKDIAINQIKVGDVLDGVVKSIAPYGCFVNLRIPGENNLNVDGLLHINDISWAKVGHPSEALAIGDEIKVAVIGLTPEERKIALGMKQLRPSPWNGLKERLKLGDRIRGVITNTTDYGCFVEIENGIEGLVHISEMSWSKKNPTLSVGQEVDVIVLAIDEEKTRISLSIKQCAENPWKKFSDKYKVGSIVPVFVKKIVDFGIFVDVGNDTEGLIHISDISWGNDTQKILSNIKIGSTINAKVLSVDIEKGRIALGLKQINRDYFEEFLARVNVGDLVHNCTIMGSWNDKLEIEIPEARTMVSLSILTLSHEQQTNKQTLCAKGQTISCKIAEVDKENRKLTIVGVDYDLSKFQKKEEVVQPKNVDSSSASISESKN